MFNFLRRSKINRLKMTAARLKSQLSPMHECLTTFNSEGRGDHHWVLCLRQEIQRREAELRKVTDRYVRLERT